jgi:hypothetical protein
MRNRQRYSLLVCCSLFAASLAACQHKSSACQLRSRYEHVTEGVGKAELTFTPNGPDHYIVHESGLGNFTGIGTFMEGVLRVVFETANGYSGTYTWDLDPTCTTGKGRLEFKTGGTGTHDSQLSALE